MNLQRIILLILFVGIIQMNYAQKGSWAEGYIITKENQADTLWGYVKRPGVLFHEQLEFRAEKKGRKHLYEAEELKEFTYLGNRYVSVLERMGVAVVPGVGLSPQSISGKTNKKMGVWIFMKDIGDPNGKIKIFCQTNKKGKELPVYTLQKEEEGWFLASSMGKFANEYVLNDIFADDPEILTWIREERTKQTDVPRLVEEYNSRH